MHTDATDRQDVADASSGQGAHVATGDLDGGGRVPAAEVSSTGRTRARRLAPWLLLLLAAMVSGIARILLNRRIEAPYILTDELQYSFAAERLAQGGELPSALWSFVYPVLISPAWLFESTLTSYGVAKSINVVLMTLVVIPVFLWTRRIAGPWYALATSAGVLMMPSFVYTGTIMTENAFFPVYLASLFAVALAIERPTVTHQLAALATFALAFVVRQQAAVLIPTMVAAVLLKSALDLRAAGESLRPRPLVRELRRYTIVWVGLALALIAYVTYTSVRGEGLASGLGAYSAATSADYSLGGAARWIAYHFGEIALTSGVFPMMALFVVGALAWFRASTWQPPERAFVAVALPACLLLVVQVGIFASRWSLRIEERNLFYIVPVLLMALALWISRGMPRPPRTVAMAAAVVSAAILVPPYGDLLNTGLENDTLGLLPIADLIRRLDGGVADLRIVIAVAAILAAALFVAVPKRLARGVVPGAVALFLVISSFGVFADVRRVGVAYRFAPAVGVDANWVDRTVGGDEEVLFLGPQTESFSDAQKLRWQTEFFNRSVAQTTLIGVDAVVDPASGFVVSTTDGEPLAARYIIADGGVALNGLRVVERPPLTMFELDEPARVETLATGPLQRWLDGPSSRREHLPLSPPRGPSTSISTWVWRAGAGQMCPQALRCCGARSCRETTALRRSARSPIRRRSSFTLASRRRSRSWGQVAVSGSRCW